jgi:hypothetical protein
MADILLDAGRAPAWRAFLPRCTGAIALLVTALGMPETGAWRGEYYDLTEDPYQLHGQAESAPPQLEGQLKDLMRCSGASCRAADGSGSP